VHRVTIPVRLIRSANARGAISFSSGTSGPWMLSSMLEVSTNGMSTAVAIFARFTAFFFTCSTSWECVHEIVPTWWSISSIAAFSGVNTFLCM
jgi:hypothetical protein